MLKEFKEFAVKGNVLDLAVGVVIGAAFGKIVTSLVNDIIMPIAGILTGGMDFKDLKLVLRPAHGKVEALTLNYGMFIQNIVDFFIVAFSIFLFIKLISKFKKEKEVEVIEEKVVETPQEVLLLQEIRDLLNKTIDTEK